MSNLSAAGTISFDLTSSVKSLDLSEWAIDLGQRFSQIDSACVRLEGDYAPGAVLATNWIPPRTYRADNFHIIVRLGKPNTTWIDKRVYARPSLQGFEGGVAFEMPLYENAAPSFWPNGDAMPDFEFLLDGQFGLSVTGILFSLPGEEIVEAPLFTLTRLSLHVDGIAIPEPSYISICNTAALCLYELRQRTRARSAS